MRIVLFDRGDTLEHHDVLLPGALEMLTAVQAMRDAQGDLLVMALVSDTGKGANAGEIAQLRNEYCAGLGRLGIASFFEPFRTRVTISSDSPEPAFVKPHASIFRAALDKIDPATSFAQALFITEWPPHILAARALGMAAIHFKGPGQETGDVERLIDVIPKIHEWLGR
jgi:FMN phosphatase YigB (HAD superfamily)